MLVACGGKNKSEADAPDEVQNAEVAEAPVEEAPPDAGAAVDMPSGLPSCHGYINTLQRYMACPKVDPQQRVQLQEAIDAMKQAWSSMANVTDPAVYATVDDACKQAIDALRQAARSLGCPL